MRLKSNLFSEVGSQRKVMTQGKWKENERGKFRRKEDFSGPEKSLLSCPIIKSNAMMKKLKMNTFLVTDFTTKDRANESASSQSSEHV